MCECACKCKLNINIILHANYRSCRFASYRIVWNIGSSLSFETLINRSLQSKKVFTIIHFRKSIKSISHYRENLITKRERKEKLTCEPLLARENAKEAKSNRIMNYCNRGLVLFSSTQNVSRYKSISAFLVNKILYPDKFQTVTIENFCKVSSEILQHIIVALIVDVLSLVWGTYLLIVPEKIQ